MSANAAAPVVVWDVDDVLNELMRAWFDERCRSEHAPGVFRFEQLTVNPPHQLLGLSESEYLHSLDSFRADHYMALKPRPETCAWFKEHGHRARHIALTGAPRALAHLSAAWVVEHYGDWIRTFAFVPSIREPRDASTRESKGDYLSWLQRGDVLVDDNSDNTLAAEALEMSGVLVPQPWNTSRHVDLKNALLHLTSLLQ